MRGWGSAGTHRDNDMTTDELKAQATAAIHDNVRRLYHDCLELLDHPPVLVGRLRGLLQQCQDLEALGRLTRAAGRVEASITAANGADHIEHWSFPGADPAQPGDNCTNKAVEKYQRAARESTHARQKAGGLTMGHPAPAVCPLVVSGTSAAALADDCDPPAVVVNTGDGGANNG